MSDTVKEIEETVETVEETEKKPWTLRDLNDEDFYSFVPIVGKVLPDEAKEALIQVFDSDDDEKKKSFEYIGKLVVFDLMKMIMKNFKAVKEDVYDLLSDLSGIPASDIKKMPFGTTPKMLKELFESERNTDFFKELFRS